ncbi:MAG: TIGR00730 family Rossman fold protein [Acidobacteriota bacterium]
MIRSVCVFMGSNAGADPIYRDAALDLGTALGHRGLDLVFGGSHVGLMGKVANAALAAGSSVVGVLPQVLSDRELAHESLTELHIVDTMHDRKALMAERADAFITLPGGLGTLEETFEVLTWGQLDIHRKPCGILNVGGYYDGLVSFLEHAGQQGFVRPQSSPLMIVEGEVETLLDRLTAATPRSS